MNLIVRQFHTEVDFRGIHTSILSLEYNRETEDLLYMLKRYQKDGYTLKYYEDLNAYEVRIITLVPVKDAETALLRAIESSTKRATKEWLETFDDLMFFQEQMKEVCE